ncbi:MAG: tyrosine-protein phosphatase [Propionibacteriaceae bacterium]|nr:tyrosine-protein phosphatase [Propionibacteriaceae bacterium]
MTRKWCGLLAALALLLGGCEQLPVVTALPGPTTPSVPAATATPTTSATATSTPTTDPTAEPALVVSGVQNFRDVAGAGLPLAGGGQMATGVVYRSGRLSDATAVDLDRIQKAGVVAVYDLRTSDVAGRSPDPEIRGAENLLINLYGDVSGDVSSASVAKAKSDSVKQDKLFVTSPSRRRALAKLLKDFAGADGPVIVHCTYGKDRTGWVSAILQATAGVDREDIVAEYLLSNEYRAEEIETAYAENKAAKGKTYADAKRASDEVAAEYLEAGLDELEARYGGIDGFLKDGLGLSESVIAKIRAKLIA